MTQKAAKPEKTGGASKGMRTRETILDAAEQVFALHGFDGVSMRQIAEASEQALGVLTYHFPSKEKLFEIVVHRRAEEINERRHAALGAFERPTLEETLEAFLGPFLDRIEHGEAGWNAYAHLLAQITHDARWSNLLSDLFGETARIFMRAVRVAVPGLTLIDAKRGYVHLVAVMVGLFASTRWMSHLSTASIDDDLDAHYRSAIRFAAAGIRALPGSEARAGGR